MQDDTLQRRGTYFTGSLNNGSFRTGYDRWEQKLIYGSLLQPTLHWRDAGLFHPHLAVHLKGCQSSWFETMLEERAIVVRIQEADIGGSSGDSLERIRLRVSKQRMSGTALEDDCDGIQTKLGRTPIEFVGWNAWNPSPRVFGEELARRVREWLGGWDMPPDFEAYSEREGMGPSGDGEAPYEEARRVWNYARVEGAAAVEEAIELTMSRGGVGLRMSDLALVLFKREIDTMPPHNVGMADVIGALRSCHGDRAHLVGAFCRAVCEKYDENYAACATLRRRTAIALDDVTRHLALGMAPSFLEEFDMRRASVGTVRLPTIRSLKELDPASRGSLREEGIDYFNALVAWQDSPTADNAETLADQLRYYANRLCKAVRSDTHSLLEVIVAGGGGTLVSAQFAELPAVSAAAVGAFSAAVFLIPRAVTSLQSSRPWSVEFAVVPTGAIRA